MSKEKMRGEKEVRETRIDEARRLREREAELAHVPHMEYNSPLNDLAKLAPPGWTYAGKRAYIGDKYDMSNWMAIEKEGWEPVLLSEHPQLRVGKGFDGNSLFHDCFFYKGVVLCKIPTSILRERKNHIAKKTYEEIVSLNTNCDKMGSMGLKPGHFMQSTKWSNSDLPYDQDYKINIGS